MRIDQLHSGLRICQQLLVLACAPEYMEFAPEAKCTSMGFRDCAWTSAHCRGHSHSSTRVRAFPWTSREARKAVRTGVNMPSTYRSVFTCGDTRTAPSVCTQTSAHTRGADRTLVNIHIRFCKCMQERRHALKHTAGALHIELGK